MAENIVFVVEDDDCVRECVTIMLEEVGVKVRAAKNAQDALRQVKSGLDFQVLVTDFEMPGMRGDELLLELRRMGYSQPAILWTGHVQPRIICGDFAAIFNKPRHVFEIRDMITFLLEKSG